MRPGRETYGAVKAALETGYRLIDTASMYGNENNVGRAVRRKDFREGRIVGSNLSCCYFGYFFPSRQQSPTAAPTVQYFLLPISNSSGFTFARSTWPSVSIASSA